MQPTKVIAPMQNSKDAVTKPSATLVFPSVRRKRDSMALPRRASAPSRSRSVPAAVPRTMETISTSVFSPLSIPLTPA